MTASTRICALLIIATAMAVMACAPQRTSTGQPVASDGKPVAGGVLRVRDAAYYHDLDPSEITKAAATMVGDRVYESLLTFKSSPEILYESQILAPRLAESWEASPDGRAFTFWLRRGVRFANSAPVNGREVTSADVRWSLEYISRTHQFSSLRSTQPGTFQFKLAGLDRVETPDPYTVTVRFSEPYAPFLTYAATPEVAVMPYELHNEGILKDKPLGSGPFQVDRASWQENSVMSFKRNPTYWDAPRPYLDEVRHIVIPDDASAIAAFQTRQIDVLPSVTTVQQWESLREKVPDAQSRLWLGANAYRVFFNVQAAPFNNVKFRQALSLATDRDEFVRVITKGKGRAGIDGGLPQMFTPEEARKLQPFDQSKARQLLAESGYSARPITIESLYATSHGEDALIAQQLLQAQWQKVGIRMNIVTADATEIADRRKSGRYQMAPAGPGQGVLEPDPDLYLWSSFNSRSSSNKHHITGPAADKKLDDLTNKQREVTDGAARMKVWREQVQYVHEQGYALWLYYAPGWDFWQSHVQNYHPNSGLDAYRLPPTVWLKRK